MLSSLTATGPMCGALWFGTGQGGEDLGSKGGLQTVKIMQILRERQGNKMKQKSRPNLSLQGDTRGPQPSPGVSDRRHPLVAVLGVLGAQLQGLLVLVGEVHGEVMLRGQGGGHCSLTGPSGRPLMVNRTLLAFKYSPWKSCLRSTQGHRAMGGEDAAGWPRGSAPPRALMETRNAGR